jgi:hypothetical protein
VRKICRARGIDQDATAREQRYWTQSPAVVAGQCAAAGQSIAAAFDAVTLSQWERPGQRSDGSMFTVESLGRYMLHDLVHHLHDVGAPLPA